MIVRERPSPWRLFFILQGSVIQRIYPQVLAIFALSIAVTWGRQHDPFWTPAYSGTALSLLGIALSVFLGFRNNAAYDRWWEGRKEWGRLVIATRDLARQTLVLETYDSGVAARRTLLHLAIAFAHETAVLLRGLTGDDRADAFLPPTLHPAFRAARHRPDFVLRAMGDLITREWRAGRLTDLQFDRLDRTLAQMSQMLGACERIRFTPLPFAYTLLLHRTAYLFCLLLPFGYADTLVWFTPVVTALITYTFFGLDALSEELEEPFGQQANDLPIFAISRTIEIQLRYAVVDIDLPESPRPADFRLD